MAVGATVQPVPSVPQTGTGNGNVDWNGTAWRFVRGFVGTLVTIVIASVATAFAGLGAVPVNFSDPRNTVKSLIVAFVLGFLTALFKAIRDKYGDPSGKGVINKFPL